MEKQVNIGDQNAQQIGQNAINQPVPTSEKPKINYTVVGTVILVCFVIFGFGGYYLGKQSTNSLLKPSNNNPNFENNISNPTASVSNNGTNAFREGEAISFAFTYPIGWSAYSKITDQSGETVELFQLDSDPIWSFPHSIAYIEGEGRRSTSPEDFDKAISNLQKDNGKNLNWKNENLAGSCFELDEYHSDMWGNVKGDIQCFVYIKSPDVRGFSGSYVLYRFDVFNGSGMIDKVDPSRSIIKSFFESIKTVSN